MRQRPENAQPRAPLASLPAKDLLSKSPSRTLTSHTGKSSLERGSDHSPSLAAPVVVDQTGQEVKPLPEKTFLQKYWFGIVVAMLFIAFNIGEEPKDNGGAAAGGGGGR